ncbi:MAG: DUF4296 domain-containing protein [Bacteroidaceae bacterium]|nr:DUF4296 domain-containing protein [Bacteroidaceae bacterium]
MNTKLNIFQVVLTFITCVVVGLVSCTPKQDGTDVIDQKMMADIIYDYHIAQSLVNQAGDSVDFRLRIYTQAILKKHNVSEEEFDNSLRYYHRNAHLLNGIYQPLSERLNEIVGKTKDMQFTTDGDTANIWMGEKFYLLDAVNTKYITLELPADTILEEGDKLEWTFNVNWLYKEGPKKATALMAIVYEGDTVTTTHYNLSSTGPQNLSMRIIDKEMKSIRVQAIQHTEWSSIPKLCLISNIKLIRYHSTQGNASQKAQRKKNVNTEPNAETHVETDAPKKEPIKFHFGNTKQ